MEQPTSFLLERVIDVCYADLSLERHIVDVLQIDNGLPYTFSRPYSSPLQQWIGLACAEACYLTSEFCIGCHVCSVISFCSHGVLGIPTYIGLIFYVTLFWSIAKHTCRVHGLKMILGWLH